MKGKRLALPKGQHWLAQFFQGLGYLSIQGGICFGLSHAAMQAIFVYHLRRFDYRLKLISFIVFKARSEVFKNNKTQEEIERIIQEKIREQFEKLSLEKRIDLLAFCDLVKVYQQIHHVPFLFEPGCAPVYQNAERTFPLALSSQLEARGGITKVDFFSGIYTKKELSLYFQGLSSFLNKPSCPYPVVLILRNDHHAIQVSYDALLHGWIFLNPARLAIRFADEDKIAQHVLAAFSSNGIAVFSTEIYVTEYNSKQERNQQVEKNSEKMKCYLKIWKEGLTFKMLHRVSSEKAKCLDSHQVSWLHLAAKRGQVDLVEKLLKKGANPYQVTDRGRTSFTVAKGRGQVEVVRVLNKSQSFFKYRLGLFGIAMIKSNKVTLDSGIAYSSQVSAPPV